MYYTRPVTQAKLTLYNSHQSLATGQFNPVILSIHLFSAVKVSTVLQQATCHINHSYVLPMQKKYDLEPDTQQYSNFHKFLHFSFYLFLWFSLINFLLFMNFTLMVNYYFSHVLTSPLTLKSPEQQRRLLRDLHLPSCR